MSSSLYLRLSGKQQREEVSRPPAAHRPHRRRGFQAPWQKNGETAARSVSQEGERHRELKNRIQRRLLDELDTDAFRKGEPLKDEELREIREMILRYVSEEESVLPMERDEVAESLCAEILGYGPIHALLQDPEISEIMVNGPDQVYVERKGRLHRTGIRFEDSAQVVQLIEKIVAPLGRRIDEASPMVDARLPDGSRVNAVIPPLSLQGPLLTIRKFSADPFRAEDLVSFDSLTHDMVSLLEACVRGRLNVIVSGGTGSGKTTLLNVLSDFIPADERIVTIEDAAELQLRQDHVLSLETRPPNIEGQGEISVRNLVRNALRMRPDRIVVGEVRSGETLDMLQAMNTGHDGSLTTAHANSPRDLLSRLETMVLMAGVELPVRAIREQIASAIDLIVHQARFRDGSRKVTHITEVQGMEGDVIVLQDLFQFHQYGLDPEGRVIGEFAATGIRPRFYERLTAMGIDLPPGLFERTLDGGRGGI